MHQARVLLLWAHLEDLLSLVFSCICHCSQSVTEIHHLQMVATMMIVTPDKLQMHQLWFLCSFAPLFHGSEIVLIHPSEIA